MKKTIRILCLIMAVMLFTSNAFAANGNIPGMDGFWGDLTSGSITVSNIAIVFEGGDSYVLDAQKNTDLQPDGSVVINATKGVLKKSLIPAIAGADEYYEPYGWAIMNADGKLEVIDLDTYKFTENTKVYALVNDLWIPYYDMKQDRSDWFYRYVRDMSIAGVINGKPDYLYDPAGKVTWGEALKLVLLATGYDEQQPIDAHWASGYLAEARKNALVTGDVDLNAAITRLDFARLTAKAMRLGNAAIASPFADTSDSAVLALYEAKIVEGAYDMNGNRVFMPASDISRAEMATIIWRVYNVAE